MVTSISMKILQRTIISMVAFGIVLYTCGNAAADEPGETGQAPALKKLLVTISEKSKTGIIANGKWYRVNSSTLVIDTVGVKLSYAALPVPCTATIFFPPVVNQDATVQKIHINEVAWGAKTGWTKPMPE